VRDVRDLVAEAFEIKKALEDELALARAPEDVEAVMVKYLGRKGALTLLVRSLGDLPKDERPRVGNELNIIKDKCELQVKERLEDLVRIKEVQEEEGNVLDVSLPGAGRPFGRFHPVAQTMEEIVSIFVSLGFSVATGPEIETDFYNFEALNFKAHHPARDMQDTFFLEDNRLLRTHTSPVQVRSMLSMGAPLRIVIPGRVYRRDSDPTHSPMFHQVEGLLLDEDVSVADLKGCLQVFVDSIFGKPLKSRFRGSYFPFTEPSIEMDVECVVCGGANPSCRVCKGTGWLEILGAGMVHPNVLRSGGVDPDRFGGFAWGMGVDRIAMLKYGLSDLRPLFEADLSYLSGGMVR
jgi:phenylalanyl-tRNA synthetase alpha chain